ncbi:hypothetical protein ACLB1M_27190 [Escherichia coli]
MIALAISHTAMADDIKSPLSARCPARLPSGVIWNLTARVRRLKQITPKGELRATSRLAWNTTHACDPKQAVAVANKIVNDGIKYVIGHLCSSSTQPASISMKMKVF